MENMKLLCSINEAANTIGVGRTYLYNMLQRGELESVRIGTRRLVKVASLEALVERVQVEARYKKENEKQDCRWCWNGDRL